LPRTAWTFWNYYASAAWTGMWIFCGKPYRFWWTVSWTPRCRRRLGLSMGNATRIAYAPQRLPQPRLGHPGGDDGAAHSQDQRGQLFPSAGGGLEPRRRSEKALLSVVQQAYVEGVSTRQVDDLIKSLGCDGISKSQVSRICRDLDQVVEPTWDGPWTAVPTPTCGWTL